MWTPAAVALGLGKGTVGASLVVGAECAGSGGVDALGPANIGSRAPVVEGAGNCAESRGATGLDLGNEEGGARVVDEVAGAGNRAVRAEDELDVEKAAASVVDVNGDGNGGMNCAVGALSMVSHSIFKRSLSLTGR